MHLPPRASRPELSPVISFPTRLTSCAPLPRRQPLRTAARTLLTLVILLALALLDSPPVRADEPPGDPVDYAAQIKPLLAKYCTQCHGAEKQKGGLRLDSARLVLTGGDSGPALVAGKSGSSLLIHVLTGEDDVAAMPPAGQPQPTPADIALVRRWIDAGAPAPADEPAAAEPVVAKSNHWAFQPVVRRDPPGWPALPPGARNPIDDWIRIPLTRRGIAPAEDAPPEVLLRRVSLDLIGLPPTADELAAFLSDDQPGAYERAVDRLLNSPHYGERWGRFWLDQARYADSNGFTRDQARSIWRYREWVIAALNRDLPFDQFTIEQLAGDLLPNATLDQKVATGFHRNTLFNEEGGTDPEQFRVEAVVDRVNTTGTVFMGLSVGCAQCHDHKYDPVSQREYYQLFAYFNNCDEPRLELPTPEQLASGAIETRAKLRADIAELEKALAARRPEFEADLAAWEVSVKEVDRSQFSIPVANALNTRPENRSPDETAALEAHFKTLPATRAKYTEAARIAELRAQEPVFATTLVMQERAVPRATHVHIKGDFLRKGAAVEPAVPAVLKASFGSPAGPTRLDLARWLVDPRHPLTPRVLVNRVWQKYFGRGLVETENDFGLQGSPASHPELLDWLAAEFVSPTVDSSRGPWSLKGLHRLIVTSSTYRQSSRVRPELLELDPDNRLYARQNRLRLDAELIRDSALLASGLLSRKIGGPSVFPPQPEGVFDFTQDKKAWTPATGEDRYRRALYTHLWRSSPYPALTVFDFPDANTACTRRNRSNTPLQSLTLANDAAFVELAQGLALRALKAEVAGDTPRLEAAFRHALCRTPQSRERERLQAFLDSQRQAYAADPASAAQVNRGAPGTAANPVEQAAWTALARVLLNLDEFITRE